MLSIKRASIRRAPAVRPGPALAVIAGVVLALAGCGREDMSVSPLPPTEPAQAVTQLVADLRRNDLVAYASRALPPPLHARLETAWGERRTIWPLTELPLDDRLPGFITVLSAPGAEKTLLATYNRQFSGEQRELRSAVSTLGLFAAQYVRGADEYSEPERDHYVQLIAAVSRWGQQAPLSDPKRAKVAIPQLVAAARLTGLAGPGKFHATGMERSLRRLGPFFARFKQVLLGYGLDLDAALDSARVELIEQTGDTARVRLRYTLGGQPVDAEVRVERRAGRWYLTDLLRHAEAEAAAPAPAVGRAATP